MSRASVAAARARAAVASRRRASVRAAIEACWASIARRIELGASDRLAGWLVFGAAALIAGGLGAALLCQSWREQDRLMRTATADLEFLATMAADDLDDHGGDDPIAHARKVITRLGSRAALIRGQHLLVGDPNGIILAALPAVAAGPRSISDEIGTAQPLTVLAERAGVLRIALPDGGAALATARTLQPPLGQLVISHRLDSVMEPWRTAHLRLVLAFVGIVAMLIVLALLSLRHAARRRRADTLVQTMRDRVDMVLASGRCGLWDWNVATGEIMWSPSMYELLGSAPRAAPLDVLALQRLLHPDDPSLPNLVSRLADGTITAVDHAFRMAHTAGHWVWLRAKLERQAAVDGTWRVAGIAIDISDTMLLEERSAQADLRLRDAIEAISEAFVVWDADNRLVICNSKFQRFHNLPPHAIAVGTPYKVVMAEGTPPVIHLQISLDGAPAQGARTFEARLADGRWLQIDERRTKDGGYVSVGTDITTLKKHEEQLLESERRLMDSVIDLKKSRQTLERQAKQLTELADKYLEQKAEAESANRAKSDFLANMGHELRTPLNAILGFSEMMTLEAFGKLGAPQYLEYSNHIHASGQHLLTMISDILEMARLEAGRVRLQKEAVSLDEAMAAAVEAVTPAARANAVTVTVADPGSFTLHADRNALEKILTILLNNAVKFTPAHGSVVLRGTTAAGDAVITLVDTGVGMPPEAAARIGRPFEQAGAIMKNGIRGSGLGLAIARSLIELHDGTIAVTSQEGEGTTVVVRLPRRPNSGSILPLAVVTTPGRRATISVAASTIAGFGPARRSAS